MAKSTKNAENLYKMENVVERIIGSVIDDELAAGATVKSRKKASKKRAKKR